MLAQQGRARHDANWKSFATSGLTEKETTGTHLQGTASSKKGLQVSDISYIYSFKAIQTQSGPSSVAEAEIYV